MPLIWLASMAPLNAGAGHVRGLLVGADLLRAQDVNAGLLAAQAQGEHLVGGSRGLVCDGASFFWGVGAHGVPFLVVV